VITELEYREDRLWCEDLVGYISCSSELWAWYSVANLSWGKRSDLWIICGMSRSSWFSKKSPTKFSPHDKPSEA